MMVIRRYCGGSPRLQHRRGAGKKIDLWNFRCSASVQQGISKLSTEEISHEGMVSHRSAVRGRDFCDRPDQVTPRGVELSVNQAQAILGHWRRVYRRGYRRAYRRGYYYGRYYY